MKNNEFKGEPLLITPSEAARLLGISPKTLWTLSRQQNVIPSIRVGKRSIRYDKAMLKKWISEQPRS